MSNTNTLYCLPGDCLVKCDDQTTGLNGTYAINGYIYASMAGTVELVHNSDNTKTIEVLTTEDKRHLLPQMGSIVTCRVIAITHNVVRLNIHCIDGQVLKQPFRAILRREEICEDEKQKVSISDSFGPSDIIVAKVVGFGENNNFLVTTAHKELGVVVSLNHSGLPMKPISWTQMLCPTTYVKERRKVAQLVSTSTNNDINQ
ncbi:exosome complex component CSL4-like [Oppia nitens]|uniref:exosome complex component CSL4-like n=1 Tax=Oppia nitens TaxID=1686743 RepID=UPI0023DCA30F|nr:exosome complex component CSL4-like [Oppia nitens]